MHIAPSFPNLSVLLIDPSPHYRRIVRTMLYQAQLNRIFEASDLSSAASTFIQKQPNIVILDWDMLCDPAGRVVYVSKALLRFFGEAQEDFRAAFPGCSAKDMKRW